MTENILKPRTFQYELEVRKDSREYYFLWGDFTVNVEREVMFFPLIHFPFLSVNDFFILIN